MYTYTEKTLVVSYDHVTPETNKLKKSTQKTT